MSDSQGPYIGGGGRSSSGIHEDVKGVLGGRGDSCCGCAPESPWINGVPVWVTSAIGLVGGCCWFIGGVPARWLLFGGVDVARAVEREGKRRRKRETERASRAKVGAMVGGSDCNVY